MKQQALLAGLLALTMTSLAAAQEHRVEPLDEPAPADAVSKEVADAVESKGLRVIRGTSRTVCDIWLAKSVAVKPDFEPSFQVLYPFTPGQFVGVIRYPRKGADFRDQEIAAGVYTLRYMLQPVDGNHVGTSPTRDFFLLLPAESDRSVAALDYEKSVAQSTEASGATHPALLCLQKPPAEPVAEAGMTHDPREWWILQTNMTTQAGDAQQKSPLALVVVGVAAE